MPVTHAVAVRQRLAAARQRNQFRAARARLRDTTKLLEPFFGPSTLDQQMGKQNENDRSARTCSIR